MKLWPRATADPPADHTARESLGRIIDGLIKAREAKKEAAAARPAAGSKTSPVPPTSPLEQYDAHVIAHAQFLLDDARELARLISGAPLAAPALDATKAFYQAYGSDDIMRRFRSW